MVEGGGRGGVGGDESWKNNYKKKPEKKTVNRNLKKKEKIDTKQNTR